jgi:hypothetical protein
MIQSIWGQLLSFSSPFLHQLESNIWAQAGKSINKTTFSCARNVFGGESPHSKAHSQYNPFSSLDRKSATIDSFRKLSSACQPLQLTELRCVWLLISDLLRAARTFKVSIGQSIRRNAIIAIDTATAAEIRATGICGVTYRTCQAPCPATSTDVSAIRTLRADQKASGIAKTLLDFLPINKRCEK